VTEHKPRLGVGDAVLVPWGLDELRGRVLEVYGEPPGNERAVVAVAVPGSNGEELGEVTITYRLSELEPPGTLDLLADLEEELPRLPETLNEATAVMNELAAIATKYTERTSQATARGEGTKARLALLASYGQAIEADAIRLDELSRFFADQVDKIEPGVISLLDQISSSESVSAVAQAFVTSLRELAHKSVEASHTTEGFYASLAGLENLSKQVRPRIRLLKQAVLRFVAYFARIASLGERAGRVAPSG